LVILQLSEVILDNNLTCHVSGKSSLFRKELVHPAITEIRGDGLLLAVQLARPEYVNYAVANAPGHGLILDYFLFCENAFRIAPPLIMSNEEIVISCNRIKELLDETVNNCTIA